MASLRLFERPRGLVFLLLIAPAAAQLPYQPTRAFKSTKDSSLVYVFRPVASAPNQAQLLSLDVSSSLAPNELDFKTLYPTLPFTSADTAVPYIPVVEADGNFTVYAGACGAAPGDAKVWKFKVDGDSDQGNGTWSQEDVALGHGDGTLLAPNFLSSGISFSSSVDGEADFYAFGGMCPHADATLDNWQSSANYSNTMLELSADNSTQYSLNVAPTRGPPVAEAGFALVGLPPSYSNDTDGTQDQQQNFVLVGGHTQSAFINMSQVAMYSLPQQTWTFIGVEQLSQQHTDLAKRDQVVDVEPRSGHTTLLSSDGKKVIVYGGWIGDVNTPADPQLAILNVGEGYGGNGPWHWSVPPTSGTGPASGSGIYGHGAVMLPGNVMMVVGGYSISSSSSRLKSRDDLIQNTQSYFFNVTSNSWLSEYSPGASSSESSSSGTLSSSSSKAGLGAGLGIGLAAVLAMTIFYFWYKRCLRKKREIREKQISELARDAHHYHGVDQYGNGYGNGGDYADYLSDREAAALAVDPWFLTGRQGWKGQRNQEAERTGLLVEIPSPTRGLRRNLGGRGYHQAPRYDESRINRGSGGIHPIDEEDEIESTTNERTGMPEMIERQSAADNRISMLSTASSGPLADPFTDPDPLRSHPVLPPQNVVHFPTSLKTSGKSPVIEPGPSAPMQARTTDIRSISPNWEIVANSQSGSSGSVRTSQDKSDRTESNLSDRSNRSALSSLSARSGAASVARTLSNASAAILATITNPFSTPNPSPQNERQKLALTIPGTSQHPARQSGESIGKGGRGNADADSFTTAKTSFVQLQAEGEALLGGRPDDVENLPAARPSTSGSDGESPNLVHTPVDFYPKNSLQQPGADETTPETAPRDHKLAHAASSDTLDLSTPIDSSFATRDRSKSWIRGSVRLALARRPSSSHHNRDRTQSLTSTNHRRRRHTNDDDGSGWFGSGGDGVVESRSGSNSPTKVKKGHRRSGSGFIIVDSADATRPSTAGTGSPPRRANSDASFWRSKRGSKAWSEDEPSPMWRGERDVRDEEDWAVATPDPGKSRESLGATTEGEDWDVEAAAENRVVQVMFTVPRQRLRVINVDESRDEGSGETSDETKSTKDVIGEPGPILEATRVDKGKQRMIETDEKPLPSPPRLATPGNDKSAAVTPQGTAERIKTRSKQSEKETTPRPISNLQPFHLPPPPSPGFFPPPSPASEDDSPTLPQPPPAAATTASSHLSRSTLPTATTLSSSLTAASLISPYGANPAASTSTIGTAITAPESPVRGRPSERNLRELRKERELSRGRGLLSPEGGSSAAGTPVKEREEWLRASTPPVKDESGRRSRAGTPGTEREGLEGLAKERSKSRVSMRSDAGGSVKDLIKEIEARSKG